MGRARRSLAFGTPIVQELYLVLSWGSSLVKSCWQCSQVNFINSLKCRGVLNRGKWLTGDWRFATHESLAQKSPEFSNGQTAVLCLELEQLVHSEVAIASYSGVLEMWLGFNRSKHLCVAEPYLIPGFQP